MSKLKATSSGEIRARNALLGYWWYEQSEANKVIEEKDTRIIQLEAFIENYNRISREIIDNANHQKYKRCMAMVKWCENAILGWMGYKASVSSHQRYVKVMLFTKWRNRWLKIAEQFNEEAK